MKYVDSYKGSELYNETMHTFLEEKGISIHQFGNKCNPLVAGRFIKTLKCVTFKYKTSAGQENLCVDMLFESLDKYDYICRSQ